MGEKSSTQTLASAVAELEPEELPQLQADSAPQRVHVAWIAGPCTLDEYGRALEPLAVGLLDELVDIVALCPQGQDTQELPSPPVGILPYGRRRWWRFGRSAAEGLVEQLRRGKVQLLHALDADAWPLAAELARLMRLKCVVSSYSLTDGRRLGRLRQQVPAVVAASEPIRRQLLGYRVAPEGRVALVRPGVYQAGRATCFQNPDYRVSIVAGGPLDDYAVLGAVLRSFAELLKRKYDCVFFVLGNGRAEKPLRLLAEKLGLRHELTFVDRQPARVLPELFKAADIYVAPIPSRSIDMAGLLAMAAGIPVLATTDGAADFLIDGRTMLRFKQGDAADLTARLASLMDDRPAAIRLAEGALEHLRANHSPAGAVAALTCIYRKAVS